MNRMSLMSRNMMHVLAHEVIDGNIPIKWGLIEDTNVLNYVGRVVPKQRPRMGKNKRMFTPTETRDFEAAVKKFGMEALEYVTHYPLKVEILITDPTTDDSLIRHSEAGLCYYNKRDVDNMAKSILDGLNGVLFIDDKQVVDLRSHRVYGKVSGFKLMYRRAGLSKSEYERFVKYLKAEEAKLNVNNG